MRQMLRAADVITHPSPVSCSASLRSSQATPSLRLSFLLTPTSFHLSVSQSSTHHPEVHRPLPSTSLSQYFPSLSYAKLPLCPRLTDSCFTVSAAHPNCLQCSVSGPWAQLFVLQTSAPLNTCAHWFRTLLTLCFGHVLLWCIKLVYKMRHNWKRRKDG